MGADPERIDLETKLGFLERTVDELNEVIIAQGRQIEALESKVADLESRQAGTGDPSTANLDPLEERPPHY